MTFCPQCGRPVNPGASFCAGCGHGFAAPVPPASAMPGAPAAPVAPSPAIARARPVGVTLIGVGMIVLAGAWVAASLVALLFVMVGVGIGSAIASSFVPALGALGGALSVLAFAILFFVLVFAALGIVTGVGVLRGRSWAWAVTLILVGLAALGGLGDLAQRQMSGVFTVAVGGLVIWYFFQPDVKAWFGRA